MPPLKYSFYDQNSTAAIDAHVLGLLSATVPLAYNNATGVFSIAQADSTHSGFLTSADWVVFNSKQPALGFTPPPNTRLISTTAPLVGGGDLTADRTLSIPKATSLVDGYLSAVDWGIFNAKQSALSFPLAATLGGTGQSTVTTGDLLYGSAANVWSKLADVATGNVLLSGGVGIAPAWGQVSLTAAITGILPIANGGTNNAGPFTAGSVIFSNGTSLAQDNSKFFWDDTSFSLCIGTATQAGALTIVGASGAQNGCSIIAGPRGVASGAGGILTLTAGVGGIPASGAGGAGGAVNITSGDGGSPTLGGGGAGGTVTIKGGIGALATGTGGNGKGGAGGPVAFQGGLGGNSVVAGQPGGTGGAISFQGGAGGLNTAAGTAGVGGQFTAASGPGGNSSNAGTAGTGGTVQFTSGQGGSNTSTGNAGLSGPLNFTGNVGGNASGVGTGGNGGSLVFTAGAGGTSASGTGGNGGSLTFIPGAGSGAGTNGSIIFGNATAQVLNFVAGAGAGVPVNGVTPAAWIAVQRNGVAGFIPWYQ